MSDGGGESISFLMLAEFESFLVNDGFRLLIFFDNMSEVVETMWLLLVSLLRSILPYDGESGDFGGELQVDGGVAQAPNRAG